MHMEWTSEDEAAFAATVAFVTEFFYPVRGFRAPFVHQHDDRLDLRFWRKFRLQVAQATELAVFYGQETNHIREA